MGAQRKGQKVADVDKPIHEIIQSWPKNPKETALQLLDYYGNPDEYSLSQLT